MNITLSVDDPTITLSQGDNVVFDITTTGATGMSAYQQWLSEGNTGTFDDFYESLRGPSQYLGASATDPTEDLEGNPLEDGDFYENTVSNVLYFYRDGAFYSPELISAASADEAVSAATDGSVQIIGADLSNEYIYVEDNGYITDPVESDTGESKITTVADSIVDVNTVSDNIADVTLVADNIEIVNTVVDNIVDIQNAEENADAAIAAKDAAEAAQAATEAVYDNFDDRYLGSKAADPTTDNDGDALVIGALYFNTVVDGGQMRVYKAAGWEAAYVSLSGAMLSANNLSDVADASASRENLGVEIGVDVQAYDANIVSDASYVHTDNNYDDDAVSKLAGIEDGATADQTATEIVDLLNAADFNLDLGGIA